MTRGKQPRNNFATRLRVCLQRSIGPPPSRPRCTKAPIYPRERIRAAIGPLSFVQANVGFQGPEPLSGGPERSEADLRQCRLSGSLVDRTSRVPDGCTKPRSFALATIPPPTTSAAVSTVIARRLPDGFWVAVQEHPDGKACSGLPDLPGARKWPDPAWTVLGLEKIAVEIGNPLFALSGQFQIANGVLYEWLDLRFEKVRIHRC